jgi:hypothetical protein
MKTPRALTIHKRESCVRRRDKRRNRCAPRIEGLEGRELLTVLTVMNNSDDGFGSLRQRISIAQNGDVIQFSPLLNGDTITLTSGEIDPQSSITIQGPSAGQLAISGNSDSRIFNLQGVSLTVSGLTFENSLAQTGAAINMGAGQSLNVTDCDFLGNFAECLPGNTNTAAGGAIASASSVTVDGCHFTGNLAVGAGDDTNQLSGANASGGAIWVDTSNASLQVTDSHFTDNSAIAGGGVIGGNASGGAIACEQVSTNANGGLTGGSTVSISGSTFDTNSVDSGASANRFEGGDADGGAIAVSYQNQVSPTLTINNNGFTTNSAKAGAGLLGGTAQGGSIAINARAASAGTFHVDNSHFDRSTATGGNATVLQDSEAIGKGGAANGGALAYSTAGLNDNFTFNGDQVTNSTAQAGSAEQTDTGGTRAQGGDARGGGLYVDVTAADTAKVTVTRGTFDTDRAIGGNGGNLGLNGLPGGDAAGGGIAVLDAFQFNHTSNAGAKVNINGTSVTNSSAIGGAGGNGADAANAAGGNGGNGGNSFGGGISIDPSNSFAAVFHVTNDQLVSDQAIGGNGGHGGIGPHGFNGGNGGSGGQANGGGMAVTLGINSYGNEGIGVASLLRVIVTNSKLMVDHANGGTGGYAGNGLISGFAGPGGGASGGAMSLRGTNGDPSNLVTLDTDFLFASTAQGGTGGLGGVSIAVQGGAGGMGGSALGGGLDDALRGATHLFNTTILGNQAVGGNGGSGGSGVGFGPNGAHGTGVGGGVRVSSVPGVTAAKDVNTVIIANNADIGPDIFGNMGSI